MPAPVPHPPKPYFREEAGACCPSAPTVHTITTGQGGKDEGWAREKGRGVKGGGEGGRREKKGKAVRKGGNDGDSMRKGYYFMIANQFFGKSKRTLHTPI